MLELPYAPMLPSLPAGGNYARAVSRGLRLHSSSIAPGLLPLSCVPTARQSLLVAAVVVDVDALVVKPTKQPSGQASE